MQGTYCIYLPISTPSLDCKDSLSGSCSASWSKTTHVQHIEGLDDFQGHCPCFNWYLTHVSGVCPIGNYEHIPSWNIMDLSSGNLKELWMIYHDLPTKKWLNMVEQWHTKWPWRDFGAHWCRNPELHTFFLMVFECRYSFVTSLHLWINLVLS